MIPTSATTTYPRDPDLRRDFLVSIAVNVTSAIVVLLLIRAAKKDGLF